MFIFLTASLSSCTGWNVCNVVAFIVLNYSRMLLLGNTRRTLRRRPATLGTQFKISIGALLNTLSTKKCHYIRCIKPNENRMPRVFDINLVQHQIRYLGYVNPMTIQSLIGQNSKKFSFFTDMIEIILGLWNCLGFGGMGLLFVKLMVLFCQDSRCFAITLGHLGMGLLLR